jgi:predicted RNase H-like HicB family nuclease
LPEYIALIHKDADSDYGVSFPDFPGCVTAGSTIDEARALATEALAFHVDGMREDRQRLPVPSSMESVMIERANREAVAFLVNLPERGERHVRIQVTMAAGLVREIDAHTDNRSKFLATAAQQALQLRIKAPAKRPTTAATVRKPHRTATKRKSRGA